MQILHELLILSIFCPCRVRLVKLITIAAARILLDPVYKNLDNFMEIGECVCNVAILL